MSCVIFFPAATARRPGAPSLRLLHGFPADSGRLHPDRDPLPELDAAVGSGDPGVLFGLEPTTSPGPAAA